MLPVIGFGAFASQKLDKGKPIEPTTCTSAIAGDLVEQGNSHSTP